MTFSELWMTIKDVDKSKIILILIKEKHKKYSATSQITLLKADNTSLGCLKIGSSYNLQLSYEETETLILKMTKKSI